MNSFSDISASTNNDSATEEDEGSTLETGAEIKESIMNSCNGQTRMTQSTPKLEKSLLSKSNELIRDFAPPSMEYSYYVIASPMAGRKVSPTDTDMTSRSYSFVSMSSKDSSSSELSTVLQPAKRAPKSRGLLQSVKEKLLAEIENINIELIKMDSEKLVLVNLRNASLLYRDMICKSERNNQGIPNSIKLRATCESIELKIQDEEHALQDDLSIPNIEQIRKDLKEIIKVCNVVSGTKTPIKMTTVEELLCAIGKLYGAVDTILVIFYDDINESKDAEDGICNDVTSSPIPSPTGSEESQEQVDLNESKSSEDEQQSPTVKKQNGILNITNDQTIPLEISGKIEHDLKKLQKKLQRANKLFKGIERLSSGNPKPKSLSACFREINTMITEGLLKELNPPELWCQVIQKNLIDLQKHLLADRPGERELEHIRIIVGELSGRISTILKSNMLV